VGVPIPNDNGHVSVSQQVAIATNMWLDDSSGDHISQVKSKNTQDFAKQEASSYTDLIFFAEITASRKKCLPHSLKTSLERYVRI